MPEFVPCYYPFTTLNIGPGGDVWFCCPEWTVDPGATRLGNVMHSPLTDIWNNERARAIRRAMYANDVGGWCRIRGCPILNGNTRISMDGIKSQFRGDLFHGSTVRAIRDDNDMLDGFPSHLIISNDWRCNLCCVMCETTLHAASKSPHQEVAAVTDRIFDELERNVDSVKRIFFSGYGEPLAIKCHLRYMQHTTRNHPHLEIELLTNGLLLTPEMWETIKHNRLATIRVSVDATTREIYEKIRKGGNWEALLRNLRFLGALRRSGEIPGFEINMTVMRDNYWQVYDFLRFGEEFSCDCMGLQIIKGTLGNQNFLEPTVDWSIVEFLQEFLRSETARHPHYYVEFLRHLEDMRR